MEKRTYELSQTWENFRSSKAQLEFDILATPILGLWCGSCGFHFIKKDSKIHNLA
ncbi:MAG TPA: hypothetical protein V6D21_08335 [Candidatus Obscuribacterales bacterium]